MTRQQATQALPTADELELSAVSEAVRGFALAIETFRTAYARRYRVTVTDSLVMSALATTDHEMRPSDIARQLDISAGTLTTMLDRLETARLVVRSRDPHDRRSVRVAVTEDGRAALLSSRGDLEQAISTAVEPVDREHFAEVLNELSAALVTTTDRIRDTGPGIARSG